MVVGGRRSRRHGGAAFGKGPESHGDLTPMPVRHPGAGCSGDWLFGGNVIGVVVALLGTTALGIVGIENFLIVTFGVVVGMMLAFGINAGLMSLYEVPRLPVEYLPIGAVALWILGQLAVLAPALRAATVPPVAAMRSA